jgi:hypothetical protein
MCPGSFGSQEIKIDRHSVGSWRGSEEVGAGFVLRFGPGAKGWRCASESHYSLGSCNVFGKR